MIDLKKKKKSNIAQYASKISLNIAPPFKISIAFYAGKTKNAYQGSVLNWQAASK